jgi:hypothetical protein
MVNDKGSLDILFWSSGAHAADPGNAPSTVGSLLFQTAIAGDDNVGDEEL